MLCDFGHGSGVLALAAAALGGASGARARGADIEPSAVHAARENAAASGLEERCSFVLPPASFLRADLDFASRFGDYRAYPPADIMEEPAAQYDIVVANILPGPLRTLAPTLAALLRAGGRLAVTGCQEFQVEPLLDVYAAHGVRLRPLLRDSTAGKWVLLDGVKLGVQGGGGVELASGAG